MAGHKHGHRSRSSKSKGKRVDNSVEEHVEMQPRSPDDRVFEHDTPKDPNFWHKEAATTTWNYVQSGTTIRYDDAAGPSTRRGDRELDMERARNILEECIEPTDNGSQQTTQQHGQRQQIDQPPPKAPKGKNTARISNRWVPLFRTCQDTESDIRPFGFVTITCPLDMHYLITSSEMRARGMGML
ncbi:hypothetical protein CHU98_g5035 [Xylaria longipes]|nr:hypothetical protein CHU98_g5035 [Xylaria longipes]